MVPCDGMAGELAKLALEALHFGQAIPSAGDATFQAFPKPLQKCIFIYFYEVYKFRLLITFWVHKMLEHIIVPFEESVVRLSGLQLPKLGK